MGWACITEFWTWDHTVMMDLKEAGYGDWGGCFENYI
jgi:hypothetical protein